VFRVARTMRDAVYLAANDQDEDTPERKHPIRIIEESESVAADSHDMAFAAP